MRKLLLFLPLSLFLISTAAAQFFIASVAVGQTVCPPNSNPQFSGGGNVFGRTDIQWNQYWGSKVDVNGGVLCNPSFIGALLNAPIITNGATLNSGTLKNVPLPNIGTDVVNKSYVDAKISGLIPQLSVVRATTTVLPNSPTYSNGSSGVGATLTAGSNSTLTVDSGIVNLNERVLVKNQTNSAQDGPYYLTQVGSGGQPWVLTRVLDFDTAAEMLLNSSFFVQTGSVNGGSNWSLATPPPIVVGSSTLSFQQNGASQVYQSDGASIQLVGNVFGVKPGGTFPSGISIPTPTISGGLITGLATISTNSYIANSASDGTRINRLSDRLFVGGALANQGTPGPTTCSSGDWISKIIPNSSCRAVIASLSIPGIPFGSAFASRTSDDPTQYAFATLLMGVNDSASATFPVTTNYNETRAYATASHTIAEESDIINGGVPAVAVATASPYNMISGTPLIVNKWLSNGRPDFLGLYLGGTITIGDTVSFTFTGSAVPSTPQSISTAVIGGDTLLSIATRLNAAILANSNLSSILIPVVIPDRNMISISGAPLPNVMTVTSNVTGSATEQAVPGYGGVASAAIGLLNNSNRQFGTLAGAYKSGLVFDCLSLVGADCTDTGGFGEALALGRKASIDFYAPDRAALNPTSRIYSDVPAGKGNGLNIKLTNSGPNAAVDVETTDGMLALGVQFGSIEIPKTLIIDASPAPPTPPVGQFYEYVDQADHLLKVKGSSGTVTVLAVP